MIDAEAFLRGRSPIIPGTDGDGRASDRNGSTVVAGAVGDEGGRPCRRLRTRDRGTIDDTVPGDSAGDLDDCREAALRLLDAAPRSSGALRDRLLGKGFDEAVVDEVLERLRRVDLIDDRAYAESAVRYCAERMMGRRGTVMELTRKGVARALAEETAARAEADGVFEESAWELGRRTARRTAGMDRQVRMRRFWAAGGRKGHDPETLRRVADELFR
ncbi:regulatory protein RecX [Bifidobacterium platyrrhinorum]|uniref:Regulatory protein RecX n=1 Tax=Bifidobacterium platyrrhinorum TaxID=2661628 RepID=A0A6L9SPJ9_9BIFI|nr:regulatory protein RecX [Bifidobacterium platyrrhinorum]NEG54458.1 RecX family transcriptional regulator [Bifidobacterium platyrrhinorum]